jgi:hypothetical protein
MLKFVALLLLVCFSFGQDKNKLSGFEEARKHEENLLRQMTQKESKLTFINIRDHKAAVNGNLQIEGLNIAIKNGIAIIAEEKIKMMNSPVEAHFTGEGYLASTFLLHHAFGAVDNILFYVLDDRYPSKVQIVLNWDNRSGKYDLDSHLKSSDLHVYYRNKSERGNWGTHVSLNRDVVRGNAYEMVTIDKPSISEDYRYFVRKYRGPKDWASKKVMVYVYADNALRKKFVLQAAFGENFKNWLVFKLDSRGRIIGLDLKK